MKKLALITSHPIQYNAPLFALMAKEPEIDLMVFYTWGEGALGPKYDPDFGKEIDWDIPLLDGYKYKFLKNTSKDPGSHHFKGIINPTLNKEIEAWSPDVVWVWGWAFNSHLKAIRHFKGKVPVWFRGDSTLINEPVGFSLRKIVRRIFLTWIYRHVDKAFYVGTHNKNYFKKHGLNDAQLVYAPHAIDNDRFSDETGEKSKSALEWRKALGFKETDVVLLFAGKFEPKKNPQFLIDIAININSPNHKFLMVGNGILENAIKIETRNDSRFVFLDFQNQSQMPFLYRVADFFVLPSIGPGETWGLAMNEALASGVKTVASVYCGGAIDLINGNNGVLIKPKTELIKALNFFKDFQLATFSNKNSLLKGHSYKEIIEALKIQLKK